MMKHTVSSPESTSPTSAVKRNQASSFDLLRSEIINLYRGYIERMSASEIVQAHAQSQNEPVWREALEIFGPRRIHRLMQFGDASAIDAAKVPR
jgi:hypothetical protein